MIAARRTAAALSLLLLATPAGAWAQSTEGLGRPPAQESEKKVEAGKLSKLPKQTKFVEADYPPEALAKNIEADVVLTLDIGANGKVTQVGIAEPAQPPGMGFDEAALLAAQQFEFEPAEMNGKPIAVQIGYKYKFRLKAKAPEAAAPAGGEGAPAQGAAAAPKPVVNFSGVLRERGTRLPLAGALVTVFRDEGGATKPLGFEATADATGRFEFYDLAPGDWRVLIDPPGYYPFRTTETVRGGEGVDVTYYVEKASYNPFDVTTTAERPRKEVSRTVLSAKEIDKIPGAIGDPLAVVQNLTGVARTPAFSGQIIVRGSAPRDTRVFVDGGEVPLIYHFGGLRSVIPVGVLESIEFYPGNFSPMYGRATGGIIDVQIKKLQPKKVGGYADVSILDTGVYLEVPIGDKAAIAVAGRRSYLDLVLNALVPDDANVGLVTAPRYYDYQLLANYRPAPAHDLRAMFFGSDDQLKLLFNNPGAIGTEVTSNTFTSSTWFYRSMLQYRYVPSPRFENQFRISQGRSKTENRFGNLAFNLDFYTSQIRDQVRTRFTDSVALTVGADVLFEKTDYLVRLPLPPKEGQPMDNFDATKALESRADNQVWWGPAAHAELELKPLPNLLLLPGVRVDRFGRVRQTVAQPRATARWRLVDTLTIKGGVGLFAQEPDYDETDRVFGNPALKAERAIHYSAGVEYKPRPWITLDVTGFYKTLSDLVSPAAAQPITALDTATPRYNNGGRGRVVGLEVLARHEFTRRFSGWLAYTLSRAVRTDNGSDEERLFSFDQTHILTAIGTYVLPRNWSIGGRFRLVTGNPITPYIGGTFNATNNEYDPISGRVNSRRLGSFHQLDLRLDKRWVYRSWMLTAYLDVQNIYNRANPEGLNYSYNFRQQKSQQGLPIIPIIGLRAEF